MRIVIQRALNAKCVIDKHVYSKIDRGLVLLIGLGKDDINVDYDWYIKKVSNMRIFEDEDGKMNLSVLDIGGEILAISQFTLYANCAKGNRPSFVDALDPTNASNIYNEFCERLNSVVKTKKGVFGADMKIDFTNDGPVTIILER